jgi:hypothetical protein
MRVKQKPATRPGSLSRSRMLKWDVFERLERLELPLVGEWFERLELFER